MSSAGKRLDLRFGAFACSVQGFDDPVQPVQQILRAIQHLLEESPELADTAINFDAEAIEQLVGEVARRADLDESEVEIVPGLIIVHHGAGGDLARPSGEEDWAAAAGPAGESEPEGGYVNIFAAGGAAGSERAGSEPPADDFAERLRRMAQDDGGYRWDEDETGAPDGTVADAPDETPLNLFAAAAPTNDEPAHALKVQNLFAPPPPDEDEPSPAGEVPSDGAGGPEGEAEQDAGAGYTAAALAERAGAQSVAELMVASAAWMVLIQGQTRFTRRDVLDVFETIPGEHDRSLEARIKGFGKAARNGHLVMIEDGVFGLSRAELERFQALL